MVWQEAQRRVQGLSRNGLTRLFGLKDRQTVSAMETGIRRITASELLLAVTRFGVPLDYLTDPFRLDGEGVFSWRHTGVDPNRLSEYERTAGRWGGAHRTLAALMRRALGLNRLSRFEDAMDTGERFVAELDLGPAPALSYNRHQRGRPCKRCRNLSPESASSAWQERPMRLLRTSELSSRFEKRLEWASEVDIAVAWVTSCDAVAALIESAADTKVRIAVGLSGNATDPSALESLADTESVALRIAKPPRNGIFHWKYYCFRRIGEATCWVGSANLTRAGFHCNEEVVHEFHAGEAKTRQWFEDLWRTLDRDPTEAIAEYGERYKPPGRSPTAAEPPADEPHRPGVSFGEWSDFVRGLRARDEYCHYVVRHHDPFPRHIFGGETPWGHLRGDP